MPHIFDDRLRILRRIGAGGMGVVYLAWDIRLSQDRAVKTLPRTDPTLVSRFRREAKTMAAVNHPGLATLDGLEVWQGVPLLVMEYLAGGTLADRIRRAPLTEDLALGLGVAVAEGLGALHRAGVLHRDVKPSNIGFTSEGAPKLLDFGLAKFLASSSRTREQVNEDESTSSLTFSSADGGIRGTPAYLSPEALGGRGPSPSDDLWGLSVTLLEACTGVNPFRGSSVAATVARVLAGPPADMDPARRLTKSSRALFGELLGPLGRRPKTSD